MVTIHISAMGQKPYSNLPYLTLSELSLVKHVYTHMLKFNTHQPLPSHTSLHTWKPLHSSTQTHTKTQTQVSIHTDSHPNPLLDSHLERKVLFIPAAAGDWQLTFRSERMSRIAANFFSPVWTQHSLRALAAADRPEIISQVNTPLSRSSSSSPLSLLGWIIDSEPQQTSIRSPFLSKKQDFGSSLRLSVRDIHFQVYKWPSWFRLARTGPGATILSHSDFYLTRKWRGFGSSSPGTVPADCVWWEAQRDRRGDRFTRKH